MAWPKAGLRWSPSELMCRQSGVDADGKIVGPTVGEQASQAFRNLATILESEGASLANIVHWTIAVVDGNAFDEGFAAFQQAWNPAARPSSPVPRTPAAAAPPDYISDDVVDLSNQIMTRLRATGGRFPELVGRLGELPRYLTVSVGGQRIGMLHGDPESLAGWRLALEAMEPGDPLVRRRVGWHGQPTTATDLLDWFHQPPADT